MSGHTLGWLLNCIDQSRPYCLLGEIQVGQRVEPLENIELYQPVRHSGNTMTLHYARAQEPGPWLDLVAARGEVMVQFWLKPGEAAVTLGPVEKRGEERIPEQLKRFFLSKNCIVSFPTARRFAPSVHAVDR